ncbi:uncharacterized protein LOC112090793 [Morus notabilis]|uniref:uncharacterized protein LOC112090793 n=1 Tax=Morus notabilis TaxID=981085 RepID=UPI000CECF839|nr:uncharacterized protein LOC112090793 [Morus notabilis]
MATRAQNERPVEDRKQGYFQKFRRVPIPSFNSEGGPQEAEFWLDFIVKHLSIMGVPDEYWVEFAVYKMEGLANTWWKQSYRDEKTLEFMSLLQGDMSVREYEVKFNDLSRFAPSLVESEHLRCLKFEKGLKNFVRMSLVALRIQNFQDLVAAATRVEHDNLAYHQSKEATGRVSVSGRPSVSGGPQRSGRRNRNQGQMVGKITSGGSSSSGSDRNAPYGPRCHHCRQVGHISRNCHNRPPAQQAQSDASYSQEGHHNLCHHINHNRCHTLLC